MGDGLGLLILVMGGLILLRPQDVPGISRNFGRAVGLTVRGIKKAKEVADDAIQKSTTSSNPTFTSLRSTVQSSMSQFSDLASAVRRDMTDVPISPAQYIRSRIRKAALQNKENIRNAQKPSSSISPHDSPGEMTPPSYTSTQPVRQASITNSQVGGRGSSGSDFIARGIEEAALYQKQKDLLQQEEDSHSKG